LTLALIEQGCPKDGVILDFFAGSGTTAQAVMELNKEDGGNRKFILVQLPEKTDEGSEAYKAGYKTIADICKERMRRVIKRLSEPQMTADKDDGNDKSGEQISMGLSEKSEEKSSASSESSQTSAVGFKVFTLEPSNFKIWRTDVIENEEDLKRQIEAFQDPVKKDSEAEAMAWEILLKSGYELTTTLERVEVGGVSVYSIANGEVFLALEKITQEAIDAIVVGPKGIPSGVADPTNIKPRRVICLDSLFAGNDQLKTNTVLQMKDARIDFKTI